MQAVTSALKFEPTPDEIINLKARIIPSIDFNRKTLVLDLDETLVHCNKENDCPTYYVLITVKLPSLQTIEVAQASLQLLVIYKAKVNIRPHVTAFL